MDDNRGYWIGATDEFTEGNFYWKDEQRTPVELGPPFWAISAGNLEPNNGGIDPTNPQDCVFLYHSTTIDYKFVDTTCITKGFYLCQILN